MRISDWSSDVCSSDLKVGEQEIFGTVEAVKTVSDLYMPVTGKVLEVNHALDANPEKVNEDQYGEGWMIKVEVQGSADGLLSAAQRSEESRGGKECVSSCRSRWSPSN